MARPVLTCDDGVWHLTDKEAGYHRELTLAEYRQLLGDAQDVASELDVILGIRERLKALLLNCVGSNSRGRWSHAASYTATFELGRYLESEPL